MDSKLMLYFSSAVVSDWRLVCQVLPWPRYMALGVLYLLWINP